MEKQGTKHKEKMIAPIVITVIVIIYYLIYFGFLLSQLHGAIKWLLGIVPVAMAIAMIGICMQRIDEIRSGEEDDLSKY